MYSRILHLKVKGSSIAVLTCSDCDQAMRDCEFSEKGKTDALPRGSLCLCVCFGVGVFVHPPDVNHV